MEKTVVLIVEDEVLILMNAVDMVEDAGFAVLEACNADEAIRVLESRSDIRAVFTDINMSGSMNGLKLAHAIRGRWPLIHLIVTSGLYGPNGPQMPANAHFILKPYESRHVETALRELFGHNPSPALNDNGKKCAKVA